MRLMREKYEKQKEHSMLNDILKRIIILKADTIRLDF
jgi:hypothetical protein